MGKVKINKRTGKAVKSSESAKAQNSAPRSKGTFGRYSDYMRNSINSTGVNSPLKRATMYDDRAIAKARKTAGTGLDRYAGSLRRIQSSDDYNMNQYAGSSRRIGQQKEKRSEDFNWNQYAGSSRRIGQESGQPAKASLKDTSAPAKQKATTYTIKKGDTLGSIAKRYGVDWRALADANGIDDPNLVYAGVKLKIDPATMGKRNKRKVGVNRPRIAPPGMHAGERTFRTPTRAEATATNLPMGTGRINIDLPEDYY